MACTRALTGSVRASVLCAGRGDGKLCAQRPCSVLAMAPLKMSRALPLCLSALHHGTDPSADLSFSARHHGAKPLLPLHAVLSCKLETKLIEVDGFQTILSSQLNIVDLAGERRMLCRTAPQPCPHNKIRRLLALWAQQPQPSSQPLPYE